MLNMDSSNFIVGQLPTSGYKKLVLFIDERTVYKGPYCTDELRFRKVFERSKIMKEWGTPLMLHCEQIIDFTLKDFLPKCDKALVYPNLLRRMPITTEVQKLKNGKAYTVSKDPRMKKLSRLVDTKPELVNEDLVEAFCHLKILNVGDVGVHNVMVVDEKDVYIVDYEDTSTNPDDYYLMNRKAPKSFPFIELITPHIPAVISKLERLRLENEEHIERREKLIKYLENTLKGIITPVKERKSFSKKSSKKRGSISNG